MTIITKSQRGRASQMFKLVNLNAKIMITFEENESFDKSNILE